MKFHFLFLSCTIAVLASCNGQNHYRDPNPVLAPQTVTIAHGDTVKALGNNIMTVFQDKHHNYWFASWQDGLYKYDGKTILHFNTKNGLPHNRVEDIQEDQQGNLFFITNDVVCKFDGQNITVLTAMESTDWQLQPTDLWFKSIQFDGKAYRYDGKHLHHLQLPETILGKDWMSNHPTYPSPYAVYTFFKDHKGNIWFGTAAAGACRFNGQSFDWISEDDVTEFHNGPSNGVRSIIEDKDGYFWFNSAYRYRVYGQSNTDPSFYIREKSIGNLHGRPDSDLWEYLSITKDDNEAIWIATYDDGVYRYDGEKTTYFPVQAESKDITVYSIYKDKQGNLWLGTHENGVYKFNGKTFERFRP